MGSAADEHDDDPPDPHDDSADEELDLRPRGAVPDPLDRVWRHPTELPRVPTRRHARPALLPLVRPLAIGALGALVTVAVLAAIGAFDDDEDPGNAAARPGGGTGSDAAELLAAGPERGVVAVTVRDETGARRASGVSVRHAGEILTSATVVGNATEALVTTADGQTHDATVVGRDDATDLVLLSVSSPVPAVPVADTAPTVGDDVWIIAGPMPGTAQTWRSRGIVAATDALVVADPGPTYAGLLETDARSSPAAAGGALVDDAGQVTGIVLAPAAGRQTTLALPIAVAIAVAKDLRDDGVAAHGALGLVGVDSPGGPTVTEVQPGSAAARAGVMPGDIVVSVEGRPVLDMGELTATVRRYGPGKVVTLSILRDDEPMEFGVQLSSTVPQATT